MSENKEKEANQINLKADKNNNNIPDWLEFVTTYALVGLCVYLILFTNPGESLIKWLITIAASLAGLRDAIK